MSVTITLKPAYPFFLGKMKELRPTTAPFSRSIPSIYTTSGIVLTMLYKDGFDAEQLERLILNGELRILGTYMSVNGRYYVQAPITVISEKTNARPSKIAMMTVIEKLWAEGLFKRVGIKVPFDPSVRVEHETMLIPADKLPDVEMKAICDFKVKRGEKLGIAVDRFKRTTIQPYLYTRVDVEDIETGKGKLAFCVDVEGPNDIISSLRHRRELVRFGGESSVALACSKPDVLLTKKATKKPEEGKTYLAVSHIRVELIDKKFTIRLNDEVFSLEWCVGEVEPLGGWLLREKRPKKTVATLVPGTVFKLGRHKQKAQSDDWYFNLLNTIVEINAGKSH